MACKTCQNMRVVEPAATAQPPPLSIPAMRLQASPHAPAPAASIIYSEPQLDAAPPETPPPAIVIKPEQTAPRSYFDIRIPPAEAPDLRVLRGGDFKFTLVAIEAANVIKGFCKPVDETPAASCPECPEPPHSPVCLNPQAEKSCATQGHELGHCWTDARPVSEMVLMGRVGRSLSRLLGEGVLWLGSNGMVKAVRDVPLRVSHLWHQWFKPTPSAAPVIGQPMPFPYQVVTDPDGNPYVIQGLAEEDSITVWDHASQQFSQKPVTGFPICVREKLVSSPVLELTGFDPLSPFGDPSDLRCLKRLEGEGMIWFRRVPAPPTPACDCGTCDSNGHFQDSTTVAEFIPNPPAGAADCPPVLAFTASGPRWVSAADIGCLRGSPGLPGTNGEDGRDGEPVTITTFNACTNCP